MGSYYNLLRGGKMEEQSGVEKFLQENKFKKFLQLLTNPILQNLTGIAITIIFLAAINFFSLIPAIQKAEDDVVRLQNSIAIHAEDLLNLFIQVRHEDLSNIGLTIEEGIKDNNALLNETKTFFTSKADFLALTLINPQGKLVVGIDREGEFIATDSASYKDSVMFKSAFNSGEQYISPVYFGSNGPTLRIANAIEIDNQRVGLITGEIDLSLLWKIVRTPNVPDGKIYLVDERGNIIADPDLNRSISGENLKYRSIVDELVKGQDTVVLSQYENENKEKVVAYGLRMPSTGWGIIVEQNSTKTFEQRNRTIMVAFGFAGASVSLILLLLVGTSRLVRALFKLKKEEEIISAERNKLAVILSGISDAVIAIDHSRKIVTFNKAAERVTGFAAKDVLGKPIYEIIHVYEEEKEINDVQYAPIRMDEYEGFLFQKKDLRMVTAKKESYVDIVSGKIKEGVSVDLGCIVTVHDVTEENKLEKMKLDFVAIAAHELRTPLTTIKGYLSVFIDENKSAMNEDQNMLLSKANSGVYTLGTLIENLLNISKIERHTFEIHTEPIDWVAFVGQSVSELTARAEEKQIELKFISPQMPVPAVKVDKLRINEVIANLISNAINYTQKGGKISVFIEYKDKNVITHVSDTGKGIPPDSIPHLFTKFFRVSGELESYSKGTGLGLYISKSIVKMHKGNIWVNSVVGKGSIFSFSLPVD